MNGRLLGKRINSARKDIGLTSEKLAELCDINATYLRQIESGAKVPSMSVFITLCNNLEVSPTYLLQDSLVNPKCVEMSEIQDLWRQASPKQIKLITSIIKSALSNM